MTNIFVGNLSYQTSQDDLHAAFAAYGGVERVSIVTDRDTGQPRGFGFVEMTEDKTANCDFAVERNRASRTCNERERSSPETGRRRWRRVWGAAQ